MPKQFLMKTFEYLERKESFKNFKNMQGQNTVLNFFSSGTYWLWLVSLAFIALNSLDFLFVKESNLNTIMQSIELLGCVFSYYFYCYMYVNENYTLTCCKSNGNISIFDNMYLSYIFTPTITFIQFIWVIHRRKEITEWNMKNKMYCLEIRIPSQRNSCFKVGLHQYLHSTHWTLSLATVPLNSPLFSLGEISCLITYTQWTTALLESLQFWDSLKSLNFRDFFSLSSFLSTLWLSLVIC